MIYDQDVTFPNRLTNTGCIITTSLRNVPDGRGQKRAVNGTVPRGKRMGA